MKKSLGLLILFVVCILTTSCGNLSDNTTGNSAISSSESKTKDLLMKESRTAYSHDGIS